MTLNINCLSIRAKLTIALVSCAIFTPACLIAYTAIIEEQTLLEKKRLELQNSVQAKSQFAKSLLDTSARDVLFLSQVPAVRIFSSTNFWSKNKGTSARMLGQFAKINSTEVFVDFLKANPLYARLTYLDINGRERLRIDQREESIKIVRSRLLQNRTKEDYFKNTSVLSKGDVFISDFTGDPEKISDTESIVPVIHLATQVYDKRGVLRGILVIDVSSEILLELVRNDQAGSVAVYLIDSQGNFLIHPEVDKSWSKLLGKDYKLQNIDPVLSDLPERLKTQKERHIVTLKDELFVSPLITEYKKINEWYFVVAIPTSEMISANRFYLQIVLYISAFGILFSLIISYTFSRFWLLNPIRKLAAMSENISRGIYASMPLKIRQRDEIGQLSLSFSKTSETLAIVDEERSKHVQELRNEIIERKRAESDLLLHRTFFEQSSDAMFIANDRTKFTYINPAFCKLTGYNVDEVIGQTTELLHSDKHDPVFYEKTWKTVDTIGYWQGEVWKSRKGRGSFPALQTINTIINDHGDKHYVSIIKDISNLRKKEDALWKLAHFDQLTNLVNRKLLTERIKDAIADAYKKKHLGALIFLDLDNFKIINDSLGHNHGDLVLKTIAKRLKKAFRREDTVARLGGDEYIILLAKLTDDPASAVELTKTIIKKMFTILQSPCLINGHESHITTSLGIALFPVDGDTPGQLLMQADTAMYMAKSEGKNTFCFYHSDMQVLADQRLKLENELRMAVRLKQFKVYYQPQFDQNHQLIGYEALVRWLHPERGLVAPNDFIPIAEESDLILEIGNQVLLDVCDKLVESTNNIPKIPHISINISPRQFSHLNFIDWVHETLEQTGADPKRLVFEVTEGLIITNLERTITNMQILKKAGIRISIDDFGTGYSSLAYLKQLPIDELKIDRSFISDIETDPNDVVIVNTIVSMAQHLHLDLIAEGVETQEQLDYLIKCGCNGFQGHLLGRPVHGDELTKKTVAVS